VSCHGRPYCQGGIRGVIFPKLSCILPQRDRTASATSSKPGKYIILVKFIPSPSEKCEVPGMPLCVALEWKGPRTDIAIGNRGGGHRFAAITELGVGM